MPVRPLRLLVAALCAVVLVSLGTVPAQAASVARVSGVSLSGQDWYNGRLTLHWRAVGGATYQARWASAPSRLSATRVVASRTTYVRTGALHRGLTWYVQVRALRGGRAGAWSATKAVRFTQRWPGIPDHRAYGGGEGQVTFAWGYTPYASRYRVAWSPGWYGNWPSTMYVDQTPGAWVPQQVRSSTLTVPATPQAGDRFVPVAYGNPVYGQVEANNAFVTSSTATRKTQFKAAWPTPPQPDAGVPVRLGSYNIAEPSGSTSRLTGAAENIRAHGLDVVALQEATSTVAASMARVLGGSWAVAPGGSSSAQQVLYRSDRMTVGRSGSFTVANPQGGSIVTPWVQLTLPGSKTFKVVSVHFQEKALGADPTFQQRLDRLRDLGDSARTALAAIGSAYGAGDPVVVAGDLRYDREPWGEYAGYVPAQPTFVRAGYYDAQAAVSKVNTQFHTFNGFASQTAHPSGTGSRPDHILSQGFRGAATYVNVVNWTWNGTIPSDHNLIYADLRIPFAG